ncbi:2-dehydro-3-deoxygalactonokinase [Paracoccus sp. Z330]|uniref:2-dehydro-3-deoxygalactonokinase n=1 Tax=Paracoccus onchidii TaxID=3017813 RepID=A0ABT4ZGC0_9RHOB|nr:2-dehydro-3-deoxygalactonokinase [Paracoccus onchidii]MDB6178383.1 2-dehydro-3-deoxygalactonokinase [Paracoccus onchidii]
MTKPELVAIDWGSTSFRMWLIGPDGEILAERRSAEGMIHCNRTGFADVLLSHLQALNVAPDVPVIACGMVGARQGWVEAPYLDTGVPLDQLTQHVARADFSRNPVTILPGVAQRGIGAPDVIRGEETQAMGLVDQGEAVVVMPGTHSKWVELKDRAIHRFSTYMTGELFAIISAHSTVAPSLEADHVISESDPGFVQGLEMALDDPSNALETLFSLRAGVLLQELAPDAAKGKLSGLLIGAELAMARRRYHDVDVHLVASGKAAALYGAALEMAGMAYRRQDAETLSRQGLIYAAKNLELLNDKSYAPA